MSELSEELAQQSSRAALQHIYAAADAAASKDLNSSSEPRCALVWMHGATEAEDVWPEKIKRSVDLPGCKFVLPNPATLSPK